MRSASARYVARFEAFDSWARRLDLGDPSFGSDAALGETAFAPLRDEPGVVGAWLSREGPDARRLSWPEHVPALPTEDWVQVRDDELGQIAVRRWTLPNGATTRPVLLIRRALPASGAATLVVTMAFE